MSDSPRFLGLDFGWQGKPTGLAALEWNGESLSLIDLSLESDLDAILAWVETFATTTTIAGVDAPLVIPNATGMRDADKLAHSMYGKYHAGAYPASQERKYWERTTRLSNALAGRGFAHGDQIPARAKGRFQVEVHPHAAIVQLNQLERIVKYKRGTLSERRAGLTRLRALIIDRLTQLTPRLELPPLPKVPATGPQLKALEDRLDAITCAYVAAYWWYWGPAGSDVLGDSSRGYIVVPKRQALLLTLANLRENYARGGLSESDLDPNPVVQFERWFEQARSAGLKEPNAMTLATATRDGAPNARIVLLKGASEDGFVFYTNYESLKGRELAENPRAALVFYWPELERQVRITGEVTRVSTAESEAYFHSRPRVSQLGAWTSRQSEPIDSREILDQRLAQREQEYAGQLIPLPPYWGGYRLMPDSLEFWQGRPSRLHDRFRYTREGQYWRVQRLSP